MFTDSVSGIRFTRPYGDEGRQSSTKVMVLTWEYAPFITGGLGVACKGLCDALISVPGISLQIVLPNLVDENAARAKLAKPSSYDGSSELISKTLSFADSVANWSLQGDFDVVHSHDWLTFSAALRVHDQHKVPFVAHVHSLEIDRVPYKPNPQIVRIEQQAFEHASTIIAVSEFTKRRIVRAYGIAPAKIQVVYNGTSADFEVGTRIPLHQRSKKVAFVGRLTTQKAPDRFLAIAEALARWDPDLTFEIVGVGDMFDSLKRQSEVRLNNKAIFRGFLTPDRVADILGDSRLMVMPSRSEPFGIAALEAVQLGTPVLASHTVGFAEAVPAVATANGFSNSALTDACMTLLTDTSLAMQQVKQATLEIKGLTWHHAARKVVEIFNELKRGPEDLSFLAGC